MRMGNLICGFITNHKGKGRAGSVQYPKNNKLEPNFVSNNNQMQKVKNSEIKYKGNINTNNISTNKWKGTNVYNSSTFNEREEYKNLYYNNDGTNSNKLKNQKEENKINGSNCDYIKMDIENNYQQKDDYNKYNESFNKKDNKSNYGNNYYRNNDNSYGYPSYNNSYNKYSSDNYGNNYSSSNQYNKNYTNSQYKNNYDYSSGGEQLDYYYKNYLDKYDYSSEEKTQNFQINGIYCGNKGLSNNGNNCFLNSTIQCLKHCLLFTKYIINESLSSYGAFGAYKSLIENMCNKNSSKLDVLNLKRAMVKYNPIYSDREQHDSTIFYNDLLNALNKELCEDSSFDEDDDIDNDEEFLIKYTQHISKSKINEYFSFFIKELTVFNCGEKMVDYQEYFYLDLPIFDENNRKLKSLEEALDTYTKKSYDYGKNTLICNKHNRKEKSYFQNIFISLPEILVISFKRVVNGRHVDHYIDYSQKLNMSKYVHNIFHQSTQYDLFAEILHYGGAYGGHKIAVCKNFNTNKWYRYNDSSVTDESEIISSNAFLLFYKRI